MNNQELKEAIGSDIEIIKSLHFEIIPAREYYGSLFILTMSAIWKLGLVAWVAIVYASLHHPTHPLVGQNTYVETMIESAFIALFMALGGMILLSSAINHYYLVRHYLKNRLKTGKLLVKKLQQSAYFFLSAFTLFCLMFASYAESAIIIFMVGLAFMMSAVTTYFVISMEMNRIGLSLLFTAVNQFFKDKAKGKTDHA